MAGVSRPKPYTIVSIYAGLTLILAAIYVQTGRFNFVNYDDGSYVYENPNIRAGLSWSAVAWAFTHIHSQNWHPLTSISHMLDCQLFGMASGGHHLVNVVLHIAVVLLLFEFLRRATGAVFKSAVASAIFASHPLRVESVAWVSERKDVLSGFFFVLTLLAYYRYCRAPDWRRLAVVMLALACGLLSKPMLVTTPVILLLLDYWPLGRTHWQRNLREKLPLLLLVIGSCIATLVAQRLALGNTQNLPMESRVSNALISYIVYLRQMFWPTDLIPFYIHPENRLAFWQPLGAAIVLIGVSAGTFLLRKTRPYLFVGWLWYLIMLVPVIGIVQVGLQGHADRYTYLPGIGIAVGFVWLVADVIGWARYSRALAIGASMTALATLAVLSYRQTTHWHDTESLWSYSLSISPNNDVAHAGLAGIQLVRGDLDGAVSHYRRAIELREGNAAAHHGLALALARERKMDEAISHWQRSVEIRPDDTQARNYLASALAATGRVDEAIAQWEQTLAWDPDNGDAANNLAWLLATSSDNAVRNGAKALEYAKRAAAAPGGDNPVVFRTLAVAYAENRRFSEATSAAEHALLLARTAGNSALTGEMQRLLQLFEQRRTFRQR